MAHGGLVASNYSTQKALDNVLTNLNSASYLGVYSNNLTPTPATVWADLVEATFSGYARVNLAGLWGSSGAIMDGEYKSDLPAQTFTGTGSSQTVYGWFVIDATPHLWLSQLFPAPITVTSGVNFSIALQLQNWALSIVTG
jgi:hypothetical protein